MPTSCGAMIGRGRATPLIRPRCNFARTRRRRLRTSCGEQPRRPRGAAAFAVRAHSLLLQPVLLLRLQQGGHAPAGPRRHLRPPAAARDFPSQRATSSASRIVEQMHFGGGTPTFLPKKRLIELIDRLDHDFKLTDCGSRGTIRSRSIRGARRRHTAAVDRPRIQPHQPGRSGLRRERAAGGQSGAAGRHGGARLRRGAALGFRSINFDLIYGLPRQSVAAFSRTLDRVIAMRPDRLAVYGYAHMPQVFKAQRQIRSDELPNAAATARDSAARRRQAVRGRLRLHRHGPLRAARPTAWHRRSRTAPCIAVFRATRRTRTAIS